MMKVEFSQLIVDLENQPIHDNQGDPTKSGPVLTLARASVNALLAIYRGEEGIDGTEKVRRFNLAQRIVDGGVVDLAAEDVVLIKTLLSKLYGPLVVGRAYAMLESGGATEPAAEPEKTPRQRADRSRQNGNG